MNNIFCDTLHGIGIVFVILMATVVIRTNASQGTSITIRDMGVIIPASGGSDTFTARTDLQSITLSENLRTYATDNAFGANSSTLILNDGTSDVVQSDVLGFLANILIVDRFSLSIGGVLSSISLPQSLLGTEIANINTTLTRISARRGVAGSAGTTTIQLEVNGSLVGSSLSWTSSDVAYTLKSATISVPIISGDALSLRLTSAETDAQDIYLQVY